MSHPNPGPHIEFPIGCEVEPANEIDAQELNVPLGTRGRVLRNNDEFLVVHWSGKSSPPPTQRWNPTRFRRVFAEVPTLASKTDNLKTANMRPNATECAACGSLLKEPWPRLKHCPKCEP